MKKLTLISGIFFLAAALFMNGTSLYASTAQEDTVKHVRKGWNMGLLPSIAFDADMGFQYGALTNFYYYGDGSTYPQYLHSIYAEAAYTTKRFGIFRLSFDSYALILNHRVSLDISYFPGQMCNFYGFNGYPSHYKTAYTQKGNPQYVTRAYYSYHRDIFRVCTDIQGRLSESGPWKWNAGGGVLFFNVGSVDVNRMNKHTSTKKFLPDTVTLFDDYLMLGYLKESETRSGTHPYVHGGVTYDTRDQLQNPQRGVFADAFLTYYAGFGHLKHYNNLKFNAAWRQYITVVPQRLVFAYRVGVQLNLAGKSPFYLNTYLNQLFLQRPLCEGLGGGNSVRGASSNRVLAHGVAFSNIELRARVFNFRIGKNMFYLGFNPFVDIGMVLQKYGDVVADPRDYIAHHSTEPQKQYYDNARTYTPHITGGCGLKVAMNENFVLSVDWGTPFNRQDNSQINNIYIKLGYMF